jgi:hypothetical protein
VFDILLISLGYGLDMLDPFGMPCQHHDAAMAVAQVLSRMAL